MGTKIPTMSDLDALMPALRAIASTTPFGFARIERSETSVEVRIDLPTPGAPVRVEAHVAYGSTWQASVSSASWSLDRPDSLRLYAGVLATAHALVALLESIR